MYSFSDCSQVNIGKPISALCKPMLCGMPSLIGPTIPFWDAYLKKISRQFVDRFFRLQGNKFSEDYTPYKKLEESMLPRDPFFKPTPKSPDVESQVS